MAATTDLFGLQETDLLLDKAQARLAEIEDSLAETEELLEARAELEAKESIVDGIRTQQKEAEEVAEDVRAKAAEIERKLYAGSVKNPKELQDLDADLRSVKELVARREDELLAILEQAEAAESEAAEVRAKLDEIEGDWKAEQAELLVEKRELEPQAEELRARRDGQAAGVDRSVLSMYDNIRARKGGLGVARLERGMCGGCRITLPVSIMQRVRGGGGVVQCVSCERILLN